MSAASYSFLDRTIHKLAFANIEMQLDFSRREDKERAAEIEEIEGAAPVFVCALPRAGTTLLLERLSQSPDFASHTYRHMPALFAPMTWLKWSENFSKSSQQVERAHADGLMISADSPEAFEEAVWMHFWPGQFQDHVISLGHQPEPNSSQTQSFKSFYQQHQKKIIATARRMSNHRAQRYLAKNNANISRLPLLRALLPDAIFLVPFRNPAAHIDSLVRQDGNFEIQHEMHAFTRQYMADLGHFEFGHLHKLIDFPNRPQWQSTKMRDVTYWAEYWLSAYTHLLSIDDRRLLFIDFDALCADPTPKLKTLFETLNASLPDQETALGENINAPQKPSVNVGSDVPDHVNTRLNNLHARLKNRASL